MSGLRSPRREDDRLLSGRAVFIDDIPEPSNTLHPRIPAQPARPCTHQIDRRQQGKGGAWRRLRLHRPGDGGTDQADAHADPERRADAGAAQFGGRRRAPCRARPWRWSPRKILISPKMRWNSSRSTIEPLPASLTVEDGRGAGRAAGPRLSAEQHRFQSQICHSRHRRGLRAGRSHSVRPLQQRAGFRRGDGAARLSVEFRPRHQQASALFDRRLSAHGAQGIGAAASSCRKRTCRWSRRMSAAPSA